MKETNIKGVILAGGLGTRLYPMTLGVSKQLLPVYDKPMIYYPLSVLMLAGIKEILIITTPQEQSAFQRMLGVGAQWGIELSYAVQEKPLGVGHALLAAEYFVEDDPVCLVLGDNLFYGQGFSGMLKSAADKKQGATAFAYPVSDVSPFGAVTLNAEGEPVSIIEKPPQAKAGLALTGLYFFDSQAVKYAKELELSERGEFEIVELLEFYLKKEQLHIQQLGRGFTWLDMGTTDTLLDASLYVQTLEKHQGFKVACLEEIAWRNGWMGQGMLRQQATKFAGSNYGRYLEQMLASVSKES